MYIKYLKLYCMCILFFQPVSSKIQAIVIMKGTLIVASLCCIVAAMGMANPRPPQPYKMTEDLEAEAQWHLQAPSQGCVEVSYTVGGSVFRSYACDATNGESVLYDIQVGLKSLFFFVFLRLHAYGSIIILYNYHLSRLLILFYPSRALYLLSGSQHMPYKFPFPSAKSGEGGEHRIQGSSS